MSEEAEVREGGPIEIHPAYTAVRFQSDCDITMFPQAFVIISAYATTGETWPSERNVEADHRLEHHLRDLGIWHARIVGYDPATGHAEPSWTAAIDLAIGCQLGRDFLQDAIFAVHADCLQVVNCAHPDTTTNLGSFTARLHQ